MSTADEAAPQPERFRGTAESQAPTVPRNRFLARRRANPVLG